MPTAGCASDTKVQLTQNKDSSTAALLPARGPKATITAKATKCSGMPQVIRRLARMPCRASPGVTQPQIQKATSIDRLMTNKPVADSIGVQPATWVIQGPAHKVCMATRPP